jgi:hypothetical protein
MLGAFFFPDDPKFSPEEIPCKDEVKSKAELNVELPPHNADFNTLALALAKDLPRAPKLPTDANEAPRWQQVQRNGLRHILRAKDYKVQATQTGSTEKDGVKATFWKLRLDNTWSVPVVELVQGTPEKTAIVLNDAGRRADTDTPGRLLKKGYRVLAVDLFNFGEAKVQQKDVLFALLLSCLGDRPLGIQAGQLAAVARWTQAEHPGDSVQVVAVGPRMSLIALAAAGLEEKVIAGLELQGARGSLKEVIEKNRTVDQMPEMFCFGLLEALDVKQLVALAAPRPVVLTDPSARAKKELAELKGWYTLLSRDFDPLARADQKK